MNKHNSRNDVMRPKHLNPDTITFSMFTTEEIKNVCVTKIVTPLMIDTLGHPISGGLYDLKLGPISEKGDPCETCQKNFYNCPGHFGYIELPLPVVNPLFHKIIGTILRISCLHCYKIQIPSHVTRAIGIQIKLLNCGLVTEALEIESKMKELIGHYESLEGIPPEELVAVDKYEQLANESSTKAYVLNKNTETLRHQFINGMIKEVKPRRVCMYCKHLINVIQVLKNKIILVERQDDSKSTKKGLVKAFESKYVTAEESRCYMRNIWIEEKAILKELISVLSQVNSDNPTDSFYFELLPVSPPNVRPVNIIGDRILENPQSQTYKTVLQNTILLRAIIQVVKKNGDANVLPNPESKAAYSYAKGNTPIEKLNNCWEEIQNNINGLVDKDSIGSRDGAGLKQIIEKKAGVIRMHMMGKRVNFAARSVITPDPNLNIDEIGIPETFAKHLTYPVPVTVWNVQELRKMIINGPRVHPGATLVEYEDGTVKRINPDDGKQQEAILKCLLTPDSNANTSFRGLKTVHRHLQNGDVLLLNRQPTLHKPSIMAHSARILKGEKTLRLHYANCKAYNADFDGDEMNAHFPQNELARSEGYNIVNVANQYLVPKDGTPLSGLIQDHMIAGVRMSLRGQFFNRDDYQQLVFQALSFKNSKIILLPPSIVKPVQLWSGKQILSTVIINIIPKDSERINLISTSKIPAKAWISGQPRHWKAGGNAFGNSNTMSEAEVVIRGGELLVGILDKTHYGATPYSLIHCIHELYGGTFAIRLLSSFAKLFTRFLQQAGFTLGVHDILTVKSADNERKNIIKESRQIGHHVMTTVLDLPEDASIETIVDRIDEGRITNPKFRAIVDRQYKGALDSYTNGINKACLPSGLICKFPQNNLQLMVQSGAKGSTVNTMQISCLLGQIELEGKRPPVMISGKSLPSFPKFEFAPRAGGFIDGRFMTGIQPQEFFFHCMAGREGLIDTAVKTSRSGYLQRCLIKHLEGLTIGYDMTVRDSDQSVIQFMYGEDGMDISRVQFLNDKQLEFLKDNSKVLLQKSILKQLKNCEDQPKLEAHHQNIIDWRANYGNPLKVERKSPFTLFSEVVKSKIGNSKKLGRKKIEQIWGEADDDIKNSFREKCVPCPDTLNAAFQPDHHFGSINERLENLINNSEFLIGKKAKKQFANVLKLKAMQSYCAPGEPVGLLAAQSIGEPSTQMTLNTFHFAGRGEMNVTLGIPRLREILMMASKNLKTPSMEVPFLDVNQLETLSENLRKTLTRVVVSDVLEKIDVTTELEVSPNRQHKYTLRFQFLPHKYYTSDYCIKPKHIIKHMRKKFFAQMFQAIKKQSKITSNIVMMEEEKAPPKKQKSNDDDEEDDGDKNPEDNAAKLNQEDENSSDDDVEDEEDAKTTNKFKQVHEDQEPEPEEIDNLSDDDAEDNKKDEDKKIENAESNDVVDAYNFAKNYTEDTKKHLWCELTFALPLNFKKLDLTAILRNVAGKSVLWETPLIRKAITYMKDDRLTLRTDGINITEMFKHNELLDLNKLYCNDIHKIAETYGIEAAMKIIVKEVQDVFNVYGIKVDPRHLSLIADYMTYNGTFEPLSRKGMETSASPLQQMSFESSLTFLKAAATRGKQDNLQNPSSCLMVGKPCTTGTGAFTLLHKIPSSC